MALTALSTELIIPIGPIPIYMFIWTVRNRNFKRYSALIHDLDSSQRLVDLEDEINTLIRERRLRTFQGLVLRNAIESKENELRKLSSEEE
ncbi:MAG: hypothetical protein Ct9H90mP16_07300 [Candidatus Poseidoniales archaeon]|nr:MAG: hypothetical protein Ct9H90mP16_07300 [Candidatus Poseidoniales archaeon]